MLYLVNVMLVYMQALSVNTQKKLVWTRKLGNGGLWRQEQCLSLQTGVLTWGYFDHHNWGDVGRGTIWHLVGKGQAAEHPTVNSPPQHPKYQALQINNAEVEKSCPMIT